MTGQANPLICEECRLSFGPSDSIVVGERPRSGIFLLHAPQRVANRECVPRPDPDVGVGLA